jgi:membrane-associated PAP2 superfamily phosphatase
MTNSKILPATKKIDLALIINSILIILALLVINFSDLDVTIQKYFFDFETKKWLIDKYDPVKKIIFYIFPKIIFGIAIIGLLIAVILGFKKNNQNFWPLSLQNTKNFLTQNHQRFFLILLGLILIPLIAGNIKKFTNVYCPNHLEIYDGDKPYVKIFDSYPAGFHQNKKAQCFPAGHCVTGFALLCFVYFIFCSAQKTSQNFWPLWCNFFRLDHGILSNGQSKGAHFFGDTLVSMLVCFLVAALITRIYLNFQKYD